MYGIGEALEVLYKFVIGLVFLGLPALFGLGILVGYWIWG